MTPRPYSLLVVDDTEANRDALSRRLTQRGYTVAVAADGAEARTVLKERAIDLVLLDIEMPEMSGLEVLKEIRTGRSQTELPVIMVTARVDGATIVEAFQSGANDYVTKPVDFPVALARIGTHLAHKSAVEALRESEERYVLAVSGARDGLWDWELARNTVHWSARWKTMLGFDDADVGTHPDEWFGRIHHDDVAAVKDRLADHLRTRGSYFESEHRLLHRNGTYRWLLCRGTAIWNEAGAATRMAGSFTDVTDTKVADALTGLPNRHLFMDLLDRAIRRAHRRPSYRFALLVLSLDRLTSVNNSLGPITADRLLVAVARRLEQGLRSTDVVSRDEPTLTLARIAGGEFHVLVDDIAHASDAIRVADRLRREFDAPFEVDGQTVFTSATAGIAVSTTGYEAPDDVLRDAAIALHRAKADGATGWELFDPAMRERAAFDLQIEAGLRGAIEHGTLGVYYQPIVRTDTGVIAGFEALARWLEPGRAVGPADFIAVAERAGMVDRVDRLILTKALHQLRAWQIRFGASAPPMLSVNASSRTFAGPSFVSDVEAILRMTDVCPSCLRLEITETAFIGDPSTARATLLRLRTLGVRCSLDDFGTGYSSLSYLHQLPVETLKIDRSFVSRMGPSGSGSEMVRTIVTLAGIVGIDVVAEGVETLAQLDELRSLRCQHVQGYYFSKPVDAKAAEHMIAAQPWRTTAAAPPTEHRRAHASVARARMPVAIDDSAD